MELLETQDPEKRKLIETSDRHRQEMKREVKDLSDRSEKILKNALVIGGVLALTYFVVDHLSSKEKKHRSRNRNKNESNETVVSVEDESPSLLSSMGDKMINVASVFLLDLAKEKLSEYLQYRKQKDENS